MKKFDLIELEKIFKEHWRPGWGSIARDEVLFVQDLIHQHRPEAFIEVGMASGLSGGLIAQMLEWSGGKSFSTIDYDNTFFGDKTKPNGFLIEDVYKGELVDVNKHPFTTTIDLHKINKTFEMAFIDANHQHPWPLIDTLCLYPYMTGSKIMIHHDLCLFRNQDVVYGIGPKYLFDQFPESARITSSANKGNIFALALGDISAQELERIAIDGFSLPWSLRTPLSDDLVELLSVIFSNNYSEKLTGCSCDVSPNSIT